MISELLLFIWQNILNFISWYDNNILYFCVENLASPRLRFDLSLRFLGCTSPDIFFYLNFPQDLFNSPYIQWNKQIVWNFGQIWPAILCSNTSNFKNYLNAKEVDKERILSTHTRNSLEWKWKLMEICKVEGKKSLIVVEQKIFWKKRTTF